jgi:hypothetical protein
VHGTSISGTKQVLCWFAIDGTCHGLTLSDDADVSFDTQSVRKGVGLG